MLRKTMVSIAFVLFCVSSVPLEAAETKDGKFTEWGWPLPYEKVSNKSVQWLKEKGWWPLQYGYSATWVAQFAVPLIVKEKQLDRARGLEIEVQSFFAGPPMNEGLIAGKLQVSSGGDLPITSLISRKAPIRSVGIIWTPVQEIQILVPIDSPLKKPADLRGKTIGALGGSSGEFAVEAYARAHGMTPGKDFVFRTTPIPDQITLPRGIDAVAPWMPTVRLMWKYHKNARIFDDTGPFIFGWGGLHVREELIQNVPDVVQAIVDMAIEAILWERLYTREAAEMMAKVPALRAYPAELIYEENVAWMNNLKPTWAYPFVNIYAAAGVKAAKWLHEKGRLRDLVTEEDYRTYFRGAPELVNRTYAKLGWKVPKEPPFFPPGVTTATFREWLKTDQRLSLIKPYELATAQSWPEPEDLERPWYFGGKWYQPKGR